MTQRTAHNPITDGPISHAILRLALPTWGAFFFHDLMGIADMFFVGKLGKLGKDAVAAVGIGTFMIGIIITLVQHRLTSWLMMLQWGACVGEREFLYPSQSHNRRGRLKTPEWKGQGICCEQKGGGRAERCASS